MRISVVCLCHHQKSDVQYVSTCAAAFVAGGKSPEAAWVTHPPWACLGELLRVDSNWASLQRNKDADLANRDEATVKQYKENAYIGLHCGTARCEMF
jgi:hypothetical protein